MRLKSLELSRLQIISGADRTSVSRRESRRLSAPTDAASPTSLTPSAGCSASRRPRRLRGKSAEDLIYAGNDSNPAAGMAEVSLLLEADEGARFPSLTPASAKSRSPAASIAPASPNISSIKIPCRLKDITEFFMAAQIHSRGYALIEQGRIEEIIQSKPARDARDDRRGRRAIAVQGTARDERAQARARARKPGARRRRVGRNRAPAWISRAARPRRPKPIRPSV